MLWVSHGVTLEDSSLVMVSLFLTIFWLWDLMVFLLGVAPNITS